MRVVRRCQPDLERQLQALLMVLRAPIEAGEHGTTSPGTRGDSSTVKSDRESHEKEATGGK
jgi:hypothetical protein